MLSRTALRRSLLHVSAVLLLGLSAAWPSVASAAPKTVCTVRINSSDEKEAFQRHLPRDQYQFVELVQRGKPDWLESARRRGVSCDVLIISGHFDDGTEFYTDRFDDREFLTVHEMQHASCSASGNGLFSQLKEVYLFGCNTLKSDPRYVASAEVVRSLVRAGHTQADAQRASALLSERYGQSNRERLRHVFKDVPVLYGFSSKAPLGRTAGPLLERYFQTAPKGEVASGRPSPTLLKLCGPSSMIAVAGLKAVDSSQIGPPPVDGVWDYKISMMAPEGKKVRRGEPVLGFDTSELGRTLEEKSAEAESAKKRIEKKKTDMEMTRRQDAMRLAEAEARLRKAQLKVEVPPELASSTELWKSRLELEEARKEIEFVKERRESSDRADAIELGSLEKQRDGAERRVREIQEAIESMTCKAPRDGTVVYVTNWRDEKKMVGDSTWRQEKIVEIPDLTRMAAKGEVDEADGGRVAEGQKVRFRLDAHPDVEFGGKVTSIWSTVQRQSSEESIEGVEQDLLALERMDTKLAAKLAAGGVKTRDDLADLAVDELVEMTGIGDDEAKPLIMKAREHWFSA